MRALVLLALAAAACGHATPATSERAARRWDSSCLIQRGCPKAVVVPAACSPDVAPLALADVMRRADELDGARIAVRGPLLRTGGMCTLLGCYGADSVETQPGGLVQRYRAPEPGKPHAMETLDDETFVGDRILLAERGCCNRCGAALALGGLVWLSGPGLSCGGDESQMCCGVDPRGQDVIARGILHHASSVPTARRSHALHASPSLIALRQTVPNQVAGSSSHSISQASGIGPPSGASTCAASSRAA